VKRLPSGRGIAALFQGTWIIKVYAPSGAEKRDARERFYTTDIMPLLPLTRSKVILVGDFNCILTQADATGRKNFNRALDTLVRGLALIDTWDHTTTRPIFTHYAPMGASRIDRTYISENIKSKKTGIETSSCLHRPFCNNSADVP
jgi:exonuclease III